MDNSVIPVAGVLMASYNHTGPDDHKPSMEYFKKDG